MGSHTLLRKQLTQANFIPRVESVLSPESGLDWQWIIVALSDIMPAGPQQLMAVVFVAATDHGEIGTGFLSDWMRFIQQILIFLLLFNI